VVALATGATHSYFGRNEFEEFAPGIKSLADAEATRNKVLQAFELAEAEEDPSRHRDLLTFVLVGAGPTGVRPRTRGAGICAIDRNTGR
jgi:NADH dehydrogenase FAD-containing subunit